MLLLGLVRPNTCTKPLLSSFLNTNLCGNFKDHLWIFVNMITQSGFVFSDRVALLFFSHEVPPKTQTYPLPLRVILVLNSGALPPEDCGGARRPGADADPGVSSFLDGLPRGVRPVHYGVLRLRPRAADGERNRARRH